MEANNNNQNVNNNNGGEGVRDPLVNVRDRLFHTLFFRLTLTLSSYDPQLDLINRLSLAYARAVPKQLRRLLECFLLLKAVLAMLLLVYIHLVYTRFAVDDCRQSQRSPFLHPGNQSNAWSTSPPPGQEMGSSGLRLCAPLLTPTPSR